MLPLAFALAAVADTPPTPTPLPVDGMALLRTWVLPDYPPDALKERVGGLATVRMIVDEKGDVASVRLLDADDARLGSAAVAAARKWVFSPALDAGRPVACSMDAPVEFFPDEAGRKLKPGELPPEGKLPQPSPLSLAKPSETFDADYPDSLLTRKLSGKVRFKCSVTPKGKAILVRVLAASHADFVIPALASLDRWVFTPAMQGDLPVQSDDVDGVISFDAGEPTPADVLAANLITAPDGTPPAAQPSPRIVADPVAPYDLLIKGEGGSATVAYTVDKGGHTQDVTVLTATGPDYGAALVAATEATLFVSAADAQGHGMAVALVQKADFPAIAPDAKDDTDPLVRLVAAVRAKQVGGAQGLDEKLAPIYRVAPAYPGALLKGGRPEGRAEIEFIIDRDGRARLPRIVSATKDEFGWAAATAVSQWIFKAPLRGGQPVDVRVRIPFDFKSPPA